MKEQEGCRAGRRRGSIDERLAAKDQARRELRGRQMQGAKGWS